MCVGEDVRGRLHGRYIEMERNMGGFCYQTRCKDNIANREVPL